MVSSKFAMRTRTTVVKPCKVPRGPIDLPPPPPPWPPDLIEIQYVITLIDQEGDPYDTLQGSITAQRYAIIGYLSIYFDPPRDWLFMLEWDPAEKTGRIQITAYDTPQFEAQLYDPDIDSPPPRLYSFALDTDLEGPIEPPEITFTL